MKVHILTNALEYGDAVSTHCILLKRRAAELGIPAGLYASSAHQEVRGELTGPPELLKDAVAEDVLLHQFFNESLLMPLVEQFPGRRVLMYHNITPPAYFSKGSPVYLSCARGLRQARGYRHLYDLALGMSEFSRRDLELMGYANTGVFPLLVDLDGLTGRRAHPVLVNQPKTAQPTFLFVGRIAPNKRIEDLLRLLAVYRREDPAAGLLLVGNDAQHPDYKQFLLRLARQLSLRVGQDVVFTGKVPETHLVAYYRRSDAFLCMSEHEGFCAPLLESMAFGLPTFAYAAPACDETMGGAGVLFRHKDFEDLAATIRGVLQDPARKQEVLAGQYRRLQDFTAEKQRRSLAALLEQVRALPPRTSIPKRVSVVINTYNRARELERCLATLQEQTYRDFEVVVVNGPSTDDTEAVLSRFGEKIHVGQTPLRVLSVSRNEGIARSSGELIAFIDDDAIAHPCWLEQLVKAFEAPDVGAAGGLVYRMNARDIEFRNGVIDREGFVLWDQPAEGLHWDWEEGYLNTVSGNNCIFRRAALEQIGGFDERIEYYHDEADVVLRLQAAGFRTVHRPAAITYHQAAPSSNRKSAYELNWFAVAKNTLYCALKNYNGELPKRRVAAHIIWRLVRQRMSPMVGWWFSGKIGLPALIRMEWACARGICVGLWRGLKPAPRYRRFAPGPQALAFLPFPARPPKQLAVCLLSQGLPEVSPGGIATYTEALAQGLRDCGCEVHVITRGSSFQSELKDGIWRHYTDRLPLPRQVLADCDYPTVAKNLEYSNAVRAKILDLEARWGLDLIESPNWDVEGLLAAMEHRHPVVVRTHSPMFQVCETQGWEFSEDLRLCAALEGVLLRHADAVTGSTNALLDLVERHFPQGDKKALLPLGLDIPAGSRVVSSHGPATVLFVGRLEPRKGIHTLLEAIPRVLASAGDVRFEIVGRDCGAGDGRSWRQYWESRCAGAARQGRVDFLGEVDGEELARRYEACDIFVAPSLYESFGLIYLEAMARAKPVVACRVGGVPEVVVDGETGLLVPPEDPPALAEAILKLLADAGLRERLGQAGRRRYEQHFTTRVMAQKTLELYRRVAGQWRSRDTVVWRAAAVELLRHPDCRIVWDPQTGRTGLLAPTGPPITAVYGPYLALRPGAYRAEFKLWLGACPPADTRLATVEAFSLNRGCLGERSVWAEDFAAGAGCVFDVFFTVTEPGVEDCEFRFHTSGAVPIYLREIVVRRWPHPSLWRALDAERIPPQARAKTGSIQG
jgi:glycosyltransferase involved in cell wall biosynthesis/GT2 family glycosyltransferase